MAPAHSPHSSLRRQNRLLKLMRPCVFSGFWPQEKNATKKEKKIWIIGVEGLMTNTFACISARRLCPLCGLCGFSPVFQKAKPSTSYRYSVSPPRALGLTCFWVPESSSLFHKPDQSSPTCSFSMRRVGWASPESMDLTEFWDERHKRHLFC